MTAEPKERHRQAEANGVTLSVEELGEGPPIVLLHGLTATRWYVVLGSKLLARRGFRLVAYEPTVPERWRETVCKVTRQRLERHRDTHALADAVRVVPGSLAFEGMEELDAMRVPTLVVGSRDEADPGHPLAVADEYAERLPDAELVVEDEGKAPLAWQGAQLSRAIQDFVPRRAPGWGGNDAGPP